MRAEQLDRLPHPRTLEDVISDLELHLGSRIPYAPARIESALTALRVRAAPREDLHQLRDDVRSLGHQLRELDLAVDASLRRLDLMCGERRP
ncbi:MAG TPA: hypothetical protein PKC43_06130 [Phycisphaerales bacterium]|nr:hypothetical protein [Phycisphaerales bacterium]HMP37010.1 hypothetical protein [Phycisphaerales bacterium]